MASTYLTTNQWMVPYKVSNKLECLNWGHLVFRACWSKSWKEGKKEKSRELSSVPSHLKAQLDAI